MIKQTIALSSALFSMLSLVVGQNHSVPGDIISPYPTLINLAIEWHIQGDDNQNGVVSVKYRRKGNGAWMEGMPLRRTPAGENEGFSWKNRHSGSIFDLQPGTPYEIQLHLKDPDGGSAQKIVQASTRPEPTITKDAEIIEFAPGVYDTLFTKSGTPERPVVYRCTKGTAIFKHIDLRDREWVYIEGLMVDNIRRSGAAEDAGRMGVGVQMSGASNCVVRGCTINAVYGIVAYKPGATNCYVSDNTVTGISQWSNDAMGAAGYNVGDGIQMTGPGNVICFNRVKGFRDNISTMEESWSVNQTCIDIYNNDISEAADDGIEADFCVSNCRIFRNRITNCYVGISSQPGLGGPTYFVRNVLYNIIHGAFKLKRFSQGDVVVHNTVVKMGTGLGGNSEMDYAYFRNNLAIGGPAGKINWGKYDAGRPSGANIFAPGKHSSFDYDAIGVYGIKDTSRIGDQLFSAVEKHGITNITLENSFHPLDFPYPPVPARTAPDLRLKSGSPAIDAALRIPNINNGYTGKAPDCGAYEFGQPIPRYGPRLKN